MLKSIITNKSEITQTYPYIGKYTDGNKPFYVLFTAPRRGVVVNSQLDTRPVGFETSTWEENRCFIPDNDIIITLSNK